jgi:hypothetical protein
MPHGDPSFLLLAYHIAAGANKRRCLFTLFLPMAVKRNMAFSAEPLCTRAVMIGKRQVALQALLLVDFYILW